MRRKVVELEEPKHQCVLVPSVVSDVELAVEFSYIAVAVPTGGRVGSGVLESWDYVFQVTHIGQIVKLTETYVHIQPVLFMEPLQEASIHVSQLFSYC